MMSNQRNRTRLEEDPGLQHGCNRRYTDLLIIGMLNVCALGQTRPQENAGAMAGISDTHIQ